MKVPVVSQESEALGSVSVSVSVAEPDGKSKSKSKSNAILVLAHGAGGTMHTPSLVALSRRLAGKGFTAVRFNFLYTESGRRSPDRQPALVACWRSVAEWVRAELRPKHLYLGGRSMGGRMASYLAADGYPCDGLVLLAYPLHPPGKPDRQRKEHLSRIRIPILFVSGTRDTFAKLELLETVVAELGAKAALHLLEGADHGFKVPKKYGKSPEEVGEDVFGAVSRFMTER